MKYEAVIFDLDGTLVCTEAAYRYETVGRVLKEFNKESSKDIINRFWFETRRDEIIKKHFKEEPEAFWKVFHQHDLPEIREKFTKVYNDIDFIQELRKNGFKTAVVTGAPLKIASFEIGMIGEKNFDAIVIANSKNGIKPKPHPHGIQECLNLLGIPENKAIFVGNSDEDVMSAKNAKVFDVFIDRKEHQFPEITPSLTISSLYELRQLLGL